ncbi:ABC transporter substrate-binding protein [Paenibacillus sp. IB182496]|uniref:ABC transporter substrate-binding protein n=1 Tax=Paenibacillus sabuli TaxID=2772509 RepID=A0A927GSI7_9BACL|nr:ABC transporter substrate-binding protein [Paenibacillus sabuli]MBD2846331.1 ABC transporter substrate-binding protein [Paenibacillus sabuli]
MNQLLRTMLLLSLVAVLLLAGCQSAEQADSDGASTPPDNASSSAAAESTGALEPVHLKYYFFGATKPGDEAVFAAINAILKKEINTTVDFIKVPNGDYTQKMSIMVNAQEEFDLAFTSPYYLNYFEHAAKGSFVDLTELLPEYAPQTYAELKPQIWDAARVNGNIYASINQQIFARQSGFSINKMLADKYRFDPASVRELADLIPFLEQVKAGEPAADTDQLYNAQMKNQVFTYFYPYYEWESIGGTDVPGIASSTEARPRVFNEYETPEFKSFILTLAEFQKKGLIAKDALTRPTFDATKYAAAPIATLMPGIEEIVKKTHDAEQYVIPLGEPILTSPNAIATMTAVSSTSRHPERALMVIEQLNTNKELFNTLVWGIEGVDYKKVGDNRVESLAGAPYSKAYGWMFGNEFNSYVSGTQPDDVWEQTKALNDSATVSTLFGFSFDPDSVKAESANCAAIVNEYRAAFNTGMYADETEQKYEEFLAKLKTAGVDKVLAEKQKQLDAFLAN